jgi:hypothetical protein
VSGQVFADEELERRREFPEVGRAGSGGSAGLAVALCTLPWLGFVPDEVRSAPPVAVARLAELLKVDASVLRFYGRRPKTRTDHLRLVAQYLG